MFVKSLVAVAAVASVVSFASTAAKADTNIDFGIDLGTGGFFPGGGYADSYSGDYPGYYPHHRRHHHLREYAPVMDYGVSCGMGRGIVRNAGFRNVSAYDCSAPTYGYQAWKHGELFQVNVSYRGDIVAVRPIY
jgi:hypothetical protein